MNRRTRKKLRRMIREEINRHLTTEGYDLYVPATMVGDRGNILLTFEYNGEAVEAYLRNSQDIMNLSSFGYAEPDEPGIRDMEDAIDKAQSGQSVDIKLKNAMAKTYAKY